MNIFAADLTKALHPETEEAAAPVSAEEAAEPVSRLDLGEILDQHGEWLSSNGESGRQADLSRSHHEGADLTDADLRQAVLNRTVLNAADLMLADLQGASLIEANLQFANLLDTKFRHANLQGATLEGATGLRSGQFAGANLFGAVLPDDFPASEGLQQATALAKRALWLIAAMLILNGITWLRIFTTGDVRLLQNGSTLPLARLQTILPLVPFYLFGPVLILGLYGCFQVYLQRLWDCVAALPAIFPDGRRLDAMLPWFARWPAQSHFPCLARETPSLSRLEAVIAMLGIYWTVPVTMLLFWGRYLTLQDLRGTTLHVLLVVAATGAALYFPRGVARAFAAGGRRQEGSIHNPSAGKKLLRRAAPPAGTGLLLFLLSVGIILGGPQGGSEPSRGTAWGPATWAAHVLSLAGYSPYARLTESNVSTKPANWTGQEEDLAAIQGANLNGSSLRHVQAYGAFFVKAHLWEADLEHANLSEADLREANLRQADLRAAFMDRAKLNRAILHQADLREADATQADFRGGDLSHALLGGAVLTDARLDGASLYGADLHMVLLDRASLTKADLREANLAGANGAMANFQEAYLSSAKMAGANLARAQLLQTILTEADLRNADLRGAVLRGAILNGANLKGANLQGADLNGAVGVDAAQICSAANIHQIQLNENVGQGVDAMCPGRR